MTFDEFEERVRKTYDENLLAFSQEMRDRYFYGEEAQEVLHSEYEWHLQRLKDGEITERIFREGVAISCGYCLSLMFE